MEKAKKIFCEMSPEKAKMVLFALSNLDNGELHACKAEPVRLLLDQTECEEPLALAKQLSFAYSEAHPRVLLQRYDEERYAHAYYRKLFRELGLRGFDYVVTVLRNTKNSIATDPKCRISEKKMLKALRWEERTSSEFPDSLESNFRHCRGLEMAGFGKMSSYLQESSYIIANVYEIL